MADNVIRNLKDVHAVASKMFKCGAKKLDDVHGKGFMGVKLIVGHKLNPAFDPNADPEKSGLTPEERKAEEHRANPRVPDTRILWIRPGTTVQELTKNHLIGIKKSLEVKVPIIDKEATGIDMMKKEGKSDQELADEVTQGKTPALDKTNPDDDIDEIGFDEEEIKEGNDEIGLPEGDPDPGEEQEDSGDSNKNEVLEAINTLSANMDTLSNDVNSINDSVTNLDRRLDLVEGKEPKKPKKKK